MRVPIDTTRPHASVTAMKSSTKMLLGRTGVLAVIVAIFALVERWLANILADDVIATILLLIVTIIIIALLSPLVSKTGRR